MVIRTKEVTEVTIEEFKEKVKVDLVGFDTSQDGIEMSMNGDGIIEYDVSNNEYQAAYDFCKKQGALDLVVNHGVKIDVGLYRNLKLLINFNDEDIKELWT